MAQFEGTALFLSLLIAFPAIIHAEAFCKETSGDIRIESTPDGATILIDGIKVGETPYSGSVSIEKTELIKTERHNPIASVMGGALFGGLGAVIGLLSGNPIAETVEGIKSGATKDIRYCVDKETQHTIKIEKSSVTYITEVSGIKDFGLVTANLSAIAFKLGEEALTEENLSEAKDYLTVVDNFGAEKLEEARELIQKIETIQNEPVKIDQEKKRQEEIAAFKQKLHDEDFARGMSLFKQGRFYPAVKAFRKALEHKDIPATRTVLTRTINRHKETTLR